MQSRNPVIKRAEQQYQDQYNGPGFAAVNSSGQQAAYGQAPSSQPSTTPYGAPTGTVPPGQQPVYSGPVTAGPGAAMTIHDVIMKTALNFVILVLFAAASWFVVMPSIEAQLNGTGSAGLAYGVMIGSMLIGLGLGLANAFKSNVSPALVILYAVFEGIFVGAISALYQVWGQSLGWGNIVGTAVVATFVVFGVMLVLYTTRIIKVTGKMRKIVSIAIISYLILSVFSLIGSFFGLGGGMGIWGYGWISVGISAMVVVLAAVVLTMDFDAIEQGIKYRVPERESWRMAFGLMVTVIWLYLEILRLLALIANASR